MIYGLDNQIDGIVLEVLLRKRRSGVTRDHERNETAEPASTGPASAAEHQLAKAEVLPPAEPDAGDVGLEKRKLAETGGRGGEAGIHARPVALTGDEALATINRMLENDPPWRWKQEARPWLVQRSVSIFSRAQWRSTFKCEPPQKRGNLALVNESDLMHAIREELDIRNKAFDTMDAVEVVHHRKLSRG